MHASTLPHFLSILVLSLNFQNFNNYKISKCVKVSAVNWDWLSKLWAFWSPKDLRAFCSLHLHSGVSKETRLSHVHKKAQWVIFIFYNIQNIYLCEYFSRKLQRFMKQKIQRALTLNEHKSTCEFFINILVFSIYKKWKCSLKLMKSSTITFLNQFSLIFSGRKYIENLMGMSWLVREWLQAKKRYWKFFRSVFWVMYHFGTICVCFKQVAIILKWKK